MIESGQFQQLWNNRLRLEIWYSSVAASALMAVAQLAALEVDRHILGRPFFVLRLPYLFVALACLIVLLRQREKLGFQAVQLMMIALTLSTFPYIGYPKRPSPILKIRGFPSMGSKYLH